MSQFSQKLKDINKKIIFFLTIKLSLYLKIIFYSQHLATELTNEGYEAKERPKTLYETNDDEIENNLSSVNDE